MPLNYCLDIFQTVIVGVRMPLNYCLDILHISDCYCWRKNAFKLLFRYLSDCYHMFHL